MVSNVRLKISPPWITHINMIKALFDGDPQITCHMNYDSDDPEVTLVCSNGDKVTALQNILPTEVSFGNVTLKINIDGAAPADRAFKNKKELFDVAFANNPVYAYSVTTDDEQYIWFAATYIVFKNCVVQFFNDNLDDCHGIISTLYENIAREVLTGKDVTGVYFNTDVEVGNIGKPLGEWP